MQLRSTLAAIGLLAASAAPALADDFTFATWNIANLHHETGVPLRDGSFAREDTDYERLASIAEAIEADVIGLQEIGSPASLRRIFADADYHLVISDRYQTGDENRPSDERDIFTAVALSKETFPELPTTETVNAFSLQHIELNRAGDGPSVRPTRSAIHVEFELNGQTVSFLNVHLKSSCHQYRVI